MIPHKIQHLTVLTRPLCSRVTFVDTVAVVLDDERDAEDTAQT